MTGNCDCSVGDGGFVVKVDTGFEGRESTRLDVTTRIPMGDRAKQQLRRTKKGGCRNVGRGSGWLG
jgi:hypothetical protein